MMRRSPAKDNIKLHIKRLKSINIVKKWQLIFGQNWQNILFFTKKLMYLRSLLITKYYPNYCSHINQFNQSFAAEQKMDESEN